MSDTSDAESTPRGTVSSGTRFGLTRWTSGLDPFNRGQLDADHADLERLAAGFIHTTAANRPAASAANVGFIHRATDSGVMTYSTGTVWVLFSDSHFEGGWSEDARSIETSINPLDANVFFRTLVANTAFSFGSVPSHSPIPAAYSFDVFLTQDATGGRVASWPTSVRWVGGASVPDLAPNRVNRYHFLTTNGGGTWWGTLLNPVAGFPSLRATGNIHANGFLRAGTQSNEPAERTRRYQGTLSSTGTATVAHGIPNLGGPRVTSSDFYYKAPDFSQTQILRDGGIRIDGTNILLAAGSIAAGLPFFGSVRFTEDDVTW